jgi:hypothetical protein
MANKTPSIVRLQPVVLADNRRVIMEMTVANLPTTLANVSLTMPGPAGPPPKPDRSAPSPYPDIELSILNSQGQPVAVLVIVEHKEPNTALTLHLRTPPDPAEPYTARAEMTYNNQVLDLVQVPFTLNR